MGRDWPWGLGSQLRGFFMARVGTWIPGGLSRCRSKLFRKASGLSPQILRVGRPWREFHRGQAARLETGPEFRRSHSATAYLPVMPGDDKIGSLEGDFGSALGRVAPSTRSLPAPGGGLRPPHAGMFGRVPARCRVRHCSSGLTRPRSLREETDGDVRRSMKKIYLDTFLFYVFSTTPFDSYPLYLSCCIWRRTDTVFVNGQL